MLKRILFPVVALLVALGPAISTQASVKPHIVYDGLTFTSNASNNGCTGTIVGVYGSSALKTYVLGTAAKYCSDQLSGGVLPANAVDVEYLSGGDSCPGVDFAADDTTDPIIGVSDVFPSGCTGAQARSSSLVTDNNAATNMVEAITNCGSTVTVPQGGSVDTPSGGAGVVPCSGAAPVGATGCASPLPAATFPYPSNLTVTASQNLWNQSATNANKILDMKKIGGCPGTAPKIQLRTPGSGTRATWCYNLYGVGIDKCSGNAPAGDQGGSGGLITAICGNPYTSTAPTDPVGTIGHTSRATVVIDPNNPGAGKSTDNLESLPAIQECGIVSLDGADGWNRDCDPQDINSVAHPTSYFTFSTTSSGSVKICNGDFQVATGNYPAWGYEHFDTSSSLTSGTNFNLLYGSTTDVPVTGGYLSYLGLGPNAAASPVAEANPQRFGFMRNCQMQVKRNPDAGPYSLAAASC